MEDEKTNEQVEPKPEVSALEASAPTTTPQEASPTTASSTSNKALPVIIILVVLGLLVGGFVFFTSNKSEDVAMEKDDETEEMMEKDESEAMEIDDKSSEVMEKEDVEVDEEDTWIAFTPDDNLFSTKFPVNPVGSTQDVPIPGSNLVIVQYIYLSTLASGSEYAVFTATYPPEVDTSAPDNNLVGALAGMVNVQPGAELVTDQKTTHDGHAARDFTINVGDGTFLQGRLIMKGSTLYQLIVSYEEGNLVEADFQKFISSFEVN